MDHLRIHAYSMISSSIGNPAVNSATVVNDHFVDEQGDSASSPSKRLKLLERPVLNFQKEQAALPTLQQIFVLQGGA